MNNVFIIAEAGVNHNGDVNIAKKMIDIASNIGVDAIKFQTYKTEKIVTKFAEKARYQNDNCIDENKQFNMLKRLELSFSDFMELKLYCDDKNILFLSTGFDKKSLDFLNFEIDSPIHKIPSGEITNLPYLEQIASYGKEIILSTGMSTIDEINAAMDVLKKKGAGRISILHCTTEYPAPKDEVNLSVINTLKERYQCTIGYSDHTAGIEIPIAAVAMGAKIIEKHFTLDKTMEGPDHKASIEPDELARMVKCIRNVEKAIGDGVKRVTNSEFKNINIARKSIVTSKKINQGEVFTTENISIKRPGNGISPMNWYEILGKKATKNYYEDELIDEKI